jgi:hypothetical protein
MPGPKPPEIHLTDEERRGLERLVNRHSTPQQVALRARIVLAAANGRNNTQIASDFEVDIHTVRRWRNRWSVLQPISLTDLSIEERLQDLPRPGSPARITTDQVCQITAMACEDPENSERPISHWTNRELADEIKKRGIVDLISPRHAARLLKRCRSQTASGALLADTSSR